MALTYKDLYTQVVEEINKRVGFDTSSPYETQGSRSQVQATAGGAVSDIDVASLITAIQNVLETSLPHRIISGLTCIATEPIGSRVIVTAGQGTAGGRLYTLGADIYVPIPFDNETEMWYVNLYMDRVLVDKAPDERKLTVAKIVVPKPGTTNKVTNEKDNTWNAYIVNQQQYDLYGDQNGFFEEETVELLRNNIGKILADNLIGNIRLSEDLKIINTQGTLEIDSKEVRILDTDGNALAKFNRNGTFFYDVDGIEVARFARDTAKIGNILITPTTLQSADFISNNKGFQITDSGYAEFEDVRVRGVIASSVFEYDRVSSVGGQLIVANSSVLEADCSPLDTTITVKDAIFSLNEVVWFKDGVNSEYMLITGVTNAPIYDVTRDWGDDYGTGATLPSWTTGIAVVSTATTGKGFIKLDSTSPYTPYLDVIYRNSLVANDLTMKVRLGNLSGVTDEAFGVLSGFGLYSDNVYLKGRLFAQEITTAVTGSRVYMDTTMFVAYDDLDVKLFQMYMEDTPGAPYPQPLDTPGQGYYGDIVMGDYDGGQGFWWDYSEATFWIRGMLDASDIQAGNLSVKYLQSGRMVGAECILDYDTSFESDDFSMISGSGTSEYGWRLKGNGNIQATFLDDGSFMKSTNYLYNTDGWKIDGSGYADINEGHIRTRVLDIDDHLSINGYNLTNVSQGLNSSDAATVQQVRNSVTRALVWWSPFEIEASTTVPAGANILCPFDATIRSFRVHCVTPSTSGNVAVDIHKNGTSIWPSGYRLVVPASTSEVIFTYLETANIYYGDKFDIYYDLAGTTTAGVTVEMVVGVNAVQSNILNVYESITVQDVQCEVNIYLSRMVYDSIINFESASILDLVVELTQAEPIITISEDKTIVVTPLIINKQESVITVSEDKTVTPPA